MLHDRIGPDLPILHEKVQGGQDALGPWLGGLDE
jgi:hypothetical protein